MTTKNTKFNQAQGAGIVDAQILSETKNEVKVIKGLNLEETLKIVEDLHKKKRQRDRLEFYIDGLQKFEIEQEEEDLNHDGYYQGCELTITDDKRNKFTTKSPQIIRKVVDFIKTTMQENLSEVEAGIVIPAA